MTYAVNVASLGSNGGTSIATWTTATRPTSPITGQMGWNATLGFVEVYSGTAWVAVGDQSAFYSVDFLVVASGVS